MKKKVKYIILFLIIILGIILIFNKIEVIEKVKKLTQKAEQIGSNENNITTIDITGITPAPESQHEHIYKTLYDDTTHWEECITCGIKTNKQIHNLTTTWALGYESCINTNSYTKTCDCGYSETGHKPCVWDGTSYRGMYPARSHIKTCSICRNDIFYLYSYNGQLYEEGLKEDNIYPDTFPQVERCYDSSTGRLITCNNTGYCEKCKGNYGEAYQPVHFIKQQEDNRLICMVCKRDFGTLNMTVTHSLNNPLIYTVNGDVILSNGMAGIDIWWYINSNGNDVFEEKTIYVTKSEQGGTVFSFEGVLKINSSLKGKISNAFAVEFSARLNGCEYDTIGQSKYIDIQSDFIEPTISNIQLSGNEWTKSKPITITGTENWTDTVNVKIENDKGLVVYEGRTNVTNNNWTISCTPEIEAGEESRIFTVTATDACENSTTKNFDVSKVDGKPPTVTSSDKVTDSEWAREKTFTFTAEDLGIGNVEIGFNDVSDYSPAVKDGTNYSKEYKFVGDAYGPVQASVYFKDGLGNITTQVVTLEKIDNTAPTITNASLNNNVVSITSHDRHTTLGEGSGVEKYRYITSTEKLENPEITPDNSQEINKDDTLMIPNINEVKYIYIVAEDMVGNTSGSYEIEVPQLVLRSEVNLDAANGKGTVTLDWTGYDITNKYFVIYRKQEDEKEWKTIVGIDEKLNSSTYVDNLGNDITKPKEPEITIEKDIQAGQIKINQTATDNGTTYTYYIESYDKNTGTLIAISNIN